MKKNNDLIGSFSRLFTQWARDKSGNVAIMFGLALLPMLIAIGVALDMTQKTRLEQKIAGTADAIALAAARAHNDVGNRDSVGQMFLNANIGTNYGPDVQVTTMSVNFDDVNRLVRVNIVAEIPTIMMGIVGHDKLISSVNSTVSYEAQVSEPVSVAMVLDVSGSMCWNDKIGTLRTAATGLLDQLNRADPDNIYVRTGLTTYNSALQETIVMDWGIANTRPVVAGLPCNGGTRSTAAFSTAHGWMRGNNEYALHAQQPIHNGEAFQLNRFMIFMTDGDNNYTIDDTNTRTRCDMAKNDGIEIFSVAFEAPLRGRDLLEYCATDIDHYYDASNSAEFLLAFQEIAARIETSLVRIVE